MTFAQKLMGLIEDPPPELAFEIAADGIAMSRTRPPAVFQYVPLPEGVLAPSPVKENVLDHAAFAETVKKLVPQGRARRNAALILPDNSVRIAVIDFDALPEKAEERRSLINFRLRKSVPFDIDEAAVSWFPQAGKKVVVALAPAEIVAHYEAPFRAAGLSPGFVTVSCLAMLDLLPATGSLLVAHRSPGTLTVIALNDGIVTIVRSLELLQDEEIFSDIYPTMAYVEDQGGGRPEKLYLAGFGSDTRLSAELEIPVELIVEPHPGLAGYLTSLATIKKAAA